MATIGDLLGFPLSLSWAYEQARGIPFGWWGACKVIGKREGVLVVACLDWFAEKQPTDADVAEAPVLVAPSWPHHNPELPMVDWRVPIKKPAELVKLGNRAVTDAEAACIDPIRSGGGWGGVWAKACGVWRWRNDRPALEKLFRSWKR